MKKYYEIGFNAIKNSEVLELIEEKIKLGEKGIIDSHIDGEYKQIACEIRKSLGVKNAISLSIGIHKETEEQWVLIHIYDYELPSEDWNCWVGIKYDEDKKLRYIQIEEEDNE